MVSDIQSSKWSPQVAPKVDIALPKQSGVPAAPAVQVGVAVADVPKKELTLQVPKSQIQFDAEKAQKNLEDAIQKLNDMLKDSGRTLSFSMDVKLGHPIVFVKNMANGDVIRQIPNEVVVRIAHGIEDFKGVLHNATS
jgi:flagellar protein FlaG